MNGLLKNALKSLGKHYCRILIINRKLDSYYPIVLEETETRWNKVGCLSDFAKWFSQNGNIYEQDKPLFERFVQSNFDGNLFYRRKCNNEYHWAYIFTEAGDNPDEEYLYVRDINDIYIQQCDLIIDSVGGVDALTGLGNKMAYETYIAINNCETVTVKIENIGTMNIEQGYKETDNFIINVANIISKYCDNVYRLHGGTFKLIIDETLVKNMSALKRALKGIATIE